MGQFLFQLTIQESALNDWHYIINLVVNQSISCAEHVELILYTVGQALLQADERITESGNSVKKGGKINYKVAQLHIFTKGQKIL